MAQWRYRAIVMGKNIESRNIYVCGYINNQESIANELEENAFIFTVLTELTSDLKNK